MRKATFCLCVVLLACVAAVAQTPAPTTKVELEELDCMSCAKKIAREVYKVAGVAEVRADLKTRMILVAHKPGATPSPRGLWEAIEKADHVPVRMETPAGTHKSKPKS